jgi:hypothetical protein
MAKLAMNMTLVRCAEDIQARAGDYLIVSPTGHCLGVYTGKVERDPAGPALPEVPPKNMKKVLAGQKGGRAKARGASSHRSEAERTALDERMLRVVRAHPGITTPELSGMLKLDNRLRKNMRTHLNRLEKRGLLRYEKAGHNDKYGFRLFPLQKEAAA